MKYKIWNKQDTLITPIGEVLTKDDVIAKYPASGIDGIDYIICDTPISLGVFMEFAQTKAHYKQMGLPITDTMSKQEVLDAISYYEENPAPVQPSPEERLAAAAEFANMLAL